MAQCSVVQSPSWGCPPCSSLVDCCVQQSPAVHHVMYDMLGSFTPREFHFGTLPPRSPCGCKGSQILPAMHEDDHQCVAQECVHSSCALTEEGGEHDGSAFSRSSLWRWLRSHPATRRSLQSRAKITHLIQDIPTQSLRHKPFQTAGGRCSLHC